jgi:hypothetical protein
LPAGSECGPNYGYHPGQNLLGLATNVRDETSSYELAASVFSLLDETKVR